MEAATVAKPRNPVFEAYRGLAILLVVAGHAQVAGFQFAGATEGVWNFYFSLCMRDVYVCANAVFLAVSGYLVGKALITSRDDYAAFLKKRLPRLLIPYTVWTVVFTVIYTVSGRPFSVGGLALRYALGGTDGPYYFIVLLFQCYLLMPVCSFLASKRYAFYILVPIHVAYVALVYVVRLKYFTADSYLDLPAYIFYNVPFLSWFSFFFLGVYIRRNPGVIDRLRSAPLLAIAAIAYGLALTESTFAAQHVGVEFATSIVRFPVMAYSAAMVLLMFKLHNRTWPRVFAVLGEYTFGIFFIHMFLLRVLDKGLQRIHWLYLCQPIYQFLMIVLVLGLCWLAITSVRRVVGKDFASKYLGF